MNERIDIPRIAQILGYTPKYVREKIVKRPDFPRPMIEVSRQCRWWDAEDVLAWASPSSRQSPQG